MNVISTLHQLLLSDQDELVIAYDNNGVKTIADLKQEVAFIYHQRALASEPRWVISCSDPWFHLVALLTAQQLGKTVVFPHNQAPATLVHYRDNAALISDDADISPEILIETPLLGDLMVSSELNQLIMSFKPTEIDALNCKIELFTSGSTAEPKLIVKSLAVFEREARMLQQQFESMDSIRNIIGSVAHFHIYGFLFRIVWPAMFGRCFDRRLAVDIDFIAEIDAQDTALIASPVMLEHLATYGQSLRLGQVFSSGGPLNFDTANVIKQLLGQYAVEVFGSSETGGIAWRRQQQPDSAWQLFDGVSYRAVNDQLVITSLFIDEIGEYYTDDLIKPLDERHFQLLGRRDRVVKLAEKRISLTAIEHALIDLDEIETAIAVVTDNSTRKVINLALTLSDAGQKNSQLSETDWWKKVRRHLAKGTESVALPRKVRILTAIPRNSQGKVDMHQLQELFR
ncbi:AMP-binding protein [Vibrio sp. MA40-2]|uniref:AMP-binding protein n=1 Tax=Vibrio sp. MA40-2 TaxID=3391828 RepID=UPI0039A62080